MTEEKIATIEPPKVFEPALALGPKGNRVVGDMLRQIVETIKREESMDQKHAVYALMGVICLSFPEETLAFVQEDFTAEER